MASATFPLPRPMPLNPINRKQRWEEFKSEFEDYALCTDIYLQSAEVQTAHFRTAMGPSWRPRLRDFKVADQTAVPAKTAGQTAGTEPCFQLTQLIKVFDKEFSSHQNILGIRESFYSCKQDGRSMEDFISEVYNRASACEFPESVKDELIRDRLALGVDSQILKDRITSSEKTELQSVLGMLRRFGNSKARARNDSITTTEPDEATEENVRFVRSNSKRSSTGRPSMNNCKFCGSKHVNDRNRCPASGKTCMKCEKKGHFAKMCTSTRRRVNQISTVSEEEEEMDQDGYTTEESFAVSVQAVGDPKKVRLMINLTVSNNHRTSTLRANVDTGATVNILPLCIFKKLVAKGLLTGLSKTNVLLKMYNGNLTKSLGRCALQCANGAVRHEIRFEVADVSEYPLLSASSSLKLDSIRLGSNTEIVHGVDQAGVTDQALRGLLEKHSTVFEGLGKLPGDVKIHLRSDATPIQCPPRKIPAAIKEQVIERIKELERFGVIQKVDCPTPWISPMLVVLREGKEPRITLDPFHLNQATKRSHFRLPILSDILPKLTNARFFTVCDCRDGFYQCTLEEESTSLTTFWTPLGRYKYNRMPQGLNVAPEIYQAKQMEALEGLHGVEVIADDILIVGYGDTDEEAKLSHLKNFRAFLERCAEKNLKLNKQKLKLCVQEVKYLGHLISKDGVKPDPEKVSTIKSMIPPTDRKSLQRFLGAANYMCRFIPKFAEIAAPLRALLKHDNNFVWMEAQSTAFDLIKEKLHSAPTLAFFDVSKPVVIQCDASAHGVGSCLMQDNKPVDYCSLTLRSAERNYAVIEKELLSIVVACKKFEHYIFAHPDVTIQTDHKPLITIFQKPLYSTPKRLQRMLLKLQKHRLKVAYVNGKDNVVADWLSRDMDTNNQLHIKPSQEYIFRTDIENIDVQKLTPIRNETLLKVKEASRADREYETLRKMIREGWSKSVKNCPDTVKNFWRVRAELTVHEGLVYRGSALVIPNSLRKEMLKTAHASHYGARALWTRARECIYWPNLKVQIEDLSNNCEACLSYQNKQAKEPMARRSLTTYPFQIVFQDLFLHRDNNYLVTVDVFSDFYEVNFIGKNPTADKVVTATKRHSARYGAPIELHTDNGPQFIAEPFKSFLRSWQVSHITSSPYFSQSNGKAEAAVKLAKKLLKKCLMNGEDVDYATLESRNIPQAEGRSRAEKFFGRKLRSKLPSVLDNRNFVYDYRQVQRNERKQTKMKEYYDRGSKRLRPLQKGSSVRVEPLNRGDIWRKASCIAEVAPRSYLVKLSNGTVIRRNRRQLRSSRETQQRSHNATHIEPVIGKEVTNRTRRTTASKRLFAETQTQGERESKRTNNRATQNRKRKAETTSLEKREKKSCIRTSPQATLRRSERLINQRAHLMDTS